MTKVFNRIVVIGAGTMGAAIAAHAANAGINVYLLDIVPNELTPEEKDKGLTLESESVRNRIVNDGWTRCLKARPANLYSKDIARRVTIGNLEDNIDWVTEADWIVEAIIERLDIKQKLMARIEKLRKPGCIVSTNTSGIPIKDIIKGRSEDFKAHFLGTHFFNPPRYLKLLELIPHSETDPEVLNTMKNFGSRTLGKGVVLCKDTPNFIANRYMGIFGTYALNYALDNNYTIEEVDLLTGPVTGFPKSATYRLYDLVGLDVLSLVNKNLYEAISHDPYRDVLAHDKCTSMIDTMVEKKLLGNKSRQGFYKKVETKEGRQFWVLDLETMEHRPPQKPEFESVEAVQNLGLVERLKKLIASNDRAGKFIWDTRSLGFNYAASIIPEAADTVISVDNACKWGFGHEMGPFETWDALGVAECVERMEADGMKVVPWVKEMLAAGNNTFYKKENGQLKCYNPAKKTYEVIEKDAWTINIADLKENKNRIIAENSSASLIDLGDDVLCLEFHSKGNSLGDEIFDMFSLTAEELEKDWVGLVIGNQSKHFCAGADLRLFMDYSERQAWGALSDLIHRMQMVLHSFRYSPKPVVSAPYGMVLGGGAEVMMGSSAICAANESYIGQAEAGVGVIPALGGCTELLRRNLSPVVKGNPNADMVPYLQKVFDLIAMGKVSANAIEAREWGFISESDQLVMNPEHLISDAKQMVLNMVAADYHPPIRGNEVWALGAEGLAALKSYIWSFKEAGWLSEHDTLITEKTAVVLTGGALSKPQWVDSEYILDLERENFLSLIAEPKTLERIKYTFNTKKVLRN